MDSQGEEVHTRSKVKWLDGVQGISGLGTKRSEDAGQGDKDGGGVGSEQGPDSHGCCRKAPPEGGLFRSEYAKWQGGSFLVPELPLVLPLQLPVFCCSEYCV